MPHVCGILDAGDHKEIRVAVGGACLKPTLQAEVVGDGDSVHPPLSG